MYMNFQYSVYTLEIWVYSCHQRLSSELGSGEFGVVRKGVWSMGGEEREVAVKTLADGSTEEKRIQFLQEAAIMSQFKHPNVITLHGVLMENHQVMDCRLFVNHPNNLFSWVHYTDITHPITLKFYSLEICSI